MESEARSVRKKLYPHNIKAEKNRTSAVCKKRNYKKSPYKEREDMLLSSLSVVKFCLAFTMIMVLMPFVFLKEIDVYLEESMLNAIERT